MHATQSVAIHRRRVTAAWGLIRKLGIVFKLRIGVAIALTALTGVAITPGPALEAWQVAVLGLAVLLSSGCAGAFNQYVEHDLDRRMRRTRSRPFVTGELHRGPGWLLVLGALWLFSVAMAVVATNVTAAVYLVLGALTYTVVYTLWLKRRTWLNIVIGGLAGSFAVLTGAAAVNPDLHALPILFALVLFVWTPSHFWSLAIALRDDYATAGVPMLPVLVGPCVTARAVLSNTIVLITVSVLPVFYGLGWLYLAGALLGGGYFLIRNLQLAADPAPRPAMASFYASLLHLALLLATAVLDAAFVSTL